MSLDFEVPKGRTSLYVGGGGRTLVTAQFAKEVGLLRTLAQNLISKLSPLGQMTQDFLRTEGLARVSRQADGLIAILRPGHEAFTELSESIIGQFPAMERGTIFANFETELFDFLATSYVGRDPASIGAAEVSALHDHFVVWFAKLASPRRIFVPSVISPWSAPRFSIGPVVFIFVEEAAQSEFYPRGNPSDILSRDGFDRMLQLMKATHANWLACVPIQGCEHQRSTLQSLPCNWQLRPWVRGPCPGSTHGAERQRSGPSRRVTATTMPAGRRWSQGYPSGQGLSPTFCGKLNR
jgi:hypothetical protein